MVTRLSASFFALVIAATLIGALSQRADAQFLGNIGTTTVTACGTGSPSLIGDNTKGVITVGTVATSCTLTFSHTLSVTPACIFQPSIGGLTLPTLTRSTANVVVNFGVQAIGGGTIAYWCFDPTARF